MSAETRLAQEQRFGVIACRGSWIAATLLAIALAGLGGLMAKRSAAGAPDDRSAEAGFARDMSTHHEQAVEMALLIRDRTADAQIKAIATDIVLTQTHQMGQMQGWLDVWGLPATGAEPPMAWMGHPSEGRMPGMASPEEVGRLSALSGDEADREFLRLMIRHHEGGVPMAQAVLERSDDEVVRRLASAIVKSQQSEVRLMQDILERRGGATPPAPASEPGDEHEHDG